MKYKRRSIWQYIGPAFVAAISYIDPGNIAVNLTSGAKYGYLLVWVIVFSSLIAAIMQYLSAKLGIVTKKSLAQLLASRFSNSKTKIAFWLQIEIVILATEIAEVIGGAIAFSLLINVSIFVGGLITSIVSIMIIMIRELYGQKIFECFIFIVLILIFLGFCAGLFINPPIFANVIKNLIPRIYDLDTAILTASIFGATIMPHAIYLHSALTRDRFCSKKTDYLFFMKTARLDIAFALIMAGSINIGILLLSAVSLQQYNIDTIDEAYHLINFIFGSFISTLFLLGLIFSSLVSTAIGSYTGVEIMQAFIKIKIPLFLRRILTLIPGLIFLYLELSPTWLLIVSQVILSFGIPFVLIPLVKLTSDFNLLREYTNSYTLTYASYCIVMLITTLNVVLIYLFLSSKF